MEKARLRRKTIAGMATEIWRSRPDLYLNLKATAHEIEKLALRGLRTHTPSPLQLERHGVMSAEAIRKHLRIAKMEGRLAMGGKDKYP